MAPATNGKAKVKKTGADGAPEAENLRAFENATAAITAYEHDVIESARVDPRAHRTAS